MPLARQYCSTAARSVGAERLGPVGPDLLAVVRVSIHPSRANRSASGRGSASSTVGESTTAVAPPWAGAVRQANIIVPGNCRV